MKKILMGMLAVALMLGMASCKEKAPADAAKDVAEKVEKAVPSLEEIVAQAKADGAKWSVDEWKSAFRNVLVNMKPMLETLQGLQEKVGDDPAKAVEMLGELQAKQKEFEGIEKLMDEFTEIAKGTENGTKVVEDEEWGKEVMKELGLPEDL
ncbi:MAG: hypothetical protein IKW98_00275 [Prevotella sp.]|nr:hypothetical protein [Prevotella sp.]